MLNVRTITDMAQVIARNLHRFDRRKFDVVIGIPRSGMLPASILATHLQLPLADPVGYGKGIVHGRSGTPVEGGSRVLLVDDTVNKGRAMAQAVKLLPRGTKITRACVYGPYQVARPEEIVDISLEHCHGPRVFGWNLWKHIRLPRWAFDLDGVFCRDPERAENDDGPQYKRFIETAEPLFLPARPIGHIVTGRLERYRSETEGWLRKQGIAFESLTMMPFATKAERMAHGGRGQWKAQQAKRLGVEMFIESSAKQAGIIAREAGIPVWCTETQGLA